MQNINEYQNKCLRTFNQSNNIEKNVIQCILGLNGEVGEITDIVKKKLFQGHNISYKQHVEEIGDVMWYIANLCNSLEIDLSAVLEQNIKKLEKRYPNGFSKEDSLKRVDIKNNLCSKEDCIYFTTKFENNCSSLKYTEQCTFLKQKKPTPKTLTNTNAEHYSNCSIQPFEYIKSNNLNFFEGNIIKYITRYKEKNGKEDLLKAKDYLDYLIKEI